MRTAINNLEGRALYQEFTKQRKMFQSAFGADPTLAEMPQVAFTKLMMLKDFRDYIDIEKDKVLFFQVTEIQVNELEEGFSFNIGPDDEEDYEI